MERTQFDTCQNQYRTRPRAVIVKPYAVGVMNALLASYVGGIIDDDTLNKLVFDQIQRGAMLASHQSVEVRLTGERQGHCFQFTMLDDEGLIGDMWWTWENNLLKREPDLKILVVGHTDKKQCNVVHCDMSLRRAKSVYLDTEV